MKISPCLSKLQLAKVDAFFRHTVEFYTMYVYVGIAVVFFRSTCSLQSLPSGGTLPRSSESLPYTRHISDPGYSHCMYFIKSF